MRFVLNLLLLATAYAFAVDSLATPVPEVLVELRSGLRQTAKLLEEDADSVTLGGTVQGEERAVRIAKTQILSMTPVPADTATTPPSALADSATPPLDWDNALLLLPLESDLDSATVQLWSGLIAQLLRENPGPRPLPVSLTDFPGCANVDCIVQKARAEGASGLFSGRLRSQKDSIEARFRIHWLQGKRTAASESKRRLPHSMAAVLQDGLLTQMLAEAAGTPAPRPRETRSWISVETDPEGATISTNAETSVCRSPCTFAYSDTGSVRIDAFWRVDANLWAGSGSTRALPGDTAKVFLKLRRTGTVAEIRSEPPGAEVLPPTPLEAQTRPLGKTPFFFYDRDPGEIKVRLWHPGYRDTVVSIRIDPLEKNVIAPTLTALADPNELARQQSLIRERRQRKIGFTLLGSSVAPFLIGSTFIMLAQGDYDEAREIKQELEQPSSGTGAGYQSKVAENREAADRGDKKFYSGIGLIGLSLLVASVGFVLVF